MGVPSLPHVFVGSGVVFVVVVGVVGAEVLPGCGQWLELIPAVVCLYYMHDL